MAEHPLECLDMWLDIMANYLINRTVKAKVLGSEMFYAEVNI